MTDEVRFGEGYEVVRPRGTFFLLAVVLAMVVGVIVWAHREPLGIAEPTGTPAAATTVVAKGCKCQHSLAVQPAGTFGWAHREWHKVSFEVWERARVGESWPLWWAESRPESR